MLRKRPLESELALPPGQIRRYQRVDIGVDPLDGKHYIYWCRGLRNKEAILERSVLTDDGRLTTIESVWNDTTMGTTLWLYTLALVPWDFPITN